MSEADIEADAEKVYFPSKAWFDVFQRRINEDERHSELSEEWGDGFNGDFVFEMTEIPIEAMDESAMPVALREQFETYVSETETDSHVARAFIGLDRTDCTEARFITADEAPEHGFHLSASIDAWKELLTGDTEIIQGIMGGTFTLDGDMQVVMRFSGSAVRLTELAGDIDAEFADEAF
jgi:putative sterol carrier protein